MKKMLMVVFVLLIGLAFVSTGFAQEKPKAAAPEKPAAAPEKPAAEKAPAPAPEKPKAEEKAKEEKPAPKPKPAYKGFAGKVAAIDAAGKTMTVKDKKAEVKVDISRPELKGYKAIGDVKVGDTVAVYYTGDAVRIQKVKGAAPAKAEKPAKEKPAKAEKKAEEPKK